MRIRKIWSFILLFIALVLAVVAAALLFAPQPHTAVEVTPTPPATDSPGLLQEPVPQGTPVPEETTVPVAVDDLPVGKWIVTEERQQYTDGDLTLRIPKLDVERTIYAGTDAATLAKGVGLYDYAQLPGEGNRNVSLAGHRNGIKNGKITDSAPFYYIDQLTDGDYLYLTDSTHIYRYVYEWTDTIEPDDWGPIATAGESCVTITSCTPIGVSDHRIVVRAVLDQIFDYADDFDYVASEEAAS